MDASEIEVALEELEQRVERLRALFEQYFMGIEKIEPSVLRKDVERRFWILRRTQIRNTAMRFKLNTISQRYNTYQQYWQRSMREIEAGTYRRHLVRAEKRFGQEALTIAARKRLGKAGADAADADKTERDTRAQKAIEQVPDLDSFDVDMDFQDMLETTAPNTADAHPLNELDDLDSLMGLSTAPSYHEPPRPPPPPRPASQRQSPSSFHATQKQDEFGDIGGIFSEDDDEQTAPHVRLPWPSNPAPEPTDRVASVPMGSKPVAGAVPRPLGPPAPPARPTIPSASAAPVRTRPAAPPHSPAPPIPAAAPVRPPPAPPSAPSRPAVRAAPPTRASQQPSTPTSTSNLTDERVREIYREYVNAKRQCNESTSNVTEASLAASLRSSETKLSEKHKGRRIDYEVVIKDGRAVLKPVVKS